MRRVCVGVQANLLRRRIHAKAQDRTFPLNDQVRRTSVCRIMYGHAFSGVPTCTLAAESFFVSVDRLPPVAVQGLERFEFEAYRAADPTTLFTVVFYCMDICGFLSGEVCYTVSPRVLSCPASDPAECYIRRRHFHPGRALGPYSARRQPSRSLSSYTEG